MNVVSKPGPMIALVVALVLLLLGKVAFAAIAMLVWVGGLAMGTMRQTATVHEEDPTLKMDPDSRSLYSPVRRLANEIRDLVEKKQESTLLQTIGQEAVSEANRVRVQVAEALQVRSELKKASRGRSLAVADLEKLQHQVAEATTEAEKRSLLSAIQARELEIGHYQRVDETIGRIDSGVRQAEAALSEMKARLAVGAGGEAAARSSSVDDLRDTMSRLKALTLSVDEVEDVLRA